MNLCEIIANSKLPVYQKVDEAINKHPDADVVVNFASSRSAYSSTLELMNYPQIKVPGKSLPRLTVRQLRSSQKVCPSVVLEKSWSEQRSKASPSLDLQPSEASSQAASRLETLVA